MATGAQPSRAFECNGVPLAGAPPWGLGSPVLGLAHVAVHNEPEARVGGGRRGCLEAAHGLVAADLVLVPLPRLLHQQITMVKSKTNLFIITPGMHLWVPRIRMPKSRLTRSGRTTLCRCGGSKS